MIKNYCRSVISASRADWNCDARWSCSFNELLRLFWLCVALALTSGNSTAFNRGIFSDHNSEVFQGKLKTSQRASGVTFPSTQPLLKQLLEFLFPLSITSTHNKRHINLSQLLCLCLLIPDSLGESFQAHNSPKLSHTLVSFIVDKEERNYLVWSTGGKGRLTLSIIYSSEVNVCIVISFYNVWLSHVGKRTEI